MSLKLQLKANQKIIINGAVIENASSKGVTLILHNRASILRDSEIITEQEAVTPASRIYFLIQCLYLFAVDAEANLPLLNQLLQDYESAAPSSREIIGRLVGFLGKGDAYQALRAARELIQHEGMVLSHGLLSDTSQLSKSADGGDFQGD